MRIRYRVDVYKKDSGTDDAAWKTTAYTTSEKQFGMEVTDSVGVGKDTFKFTLANPQGVLTTGTTAMVELDDNIKVYHWTGTASANTATDLIMDGVVKDVNYEQSPDGRSINVSGVHFIESIFNSMVFVDLPITNVHSASMEILSRVNSLQKNATQDNSRYVCGGESTEWTDSLNPTKKADGTTDFPEFSLTENKQNAAELFDKIWSNEYTGDGRYMWWVERNITDNKLNFRVAKMLDEPKGDITQGQTEIKFNSGHVLDGVFNVVIYNCGYDAYNSVQEYFYFDVESMSKYGPVCRYWDKTSHVANDILQGEFKADTGKTLFNWTDTGENDTVTSNFPKAYPYTFQFNEKDLETGDVTGGLVVVNSDKDFNKAIRKESEIRGKKIVAEVIKLNGKPVPKVNIDYTISNDPGWQVRTVYTVTGSDTMLQKGLRMRCIQKKYSDWEVSYEFEQDVERVT